MTDRPRHPKFDPTILKEGRLNEVIGGGFIVMRRGKKTGRVSINTTLPFEHGSFDAAQDEADRLAENNPGETFVVMGQVGLPRVFVAPVEKEDMA